MFRNGRIVLVAVTSFVSDVNLDLSHLMGQKWVCVVHITKGCGMNNTGLYIDFFQRFDYRT